MMSSTMTGRGITGSSAMGGMQGMMPMMPMMGGMMPSMPPGMMGGMMPAMLGLAGMTAPRCTMKVEECPGGMMVTCSAEDQAAVMMMQQMAMMMQGGMCSMCCMMNGMMMCCCNVGMIGMCKLEMTPAGMKMTCTSGDKNCEMMIQACCQCMGRMMDAGCMCCMMMNGMPVCYSAPR